MEPHQKIPIMTRQDNIIIREVTIDDLKYVEDAVTVVNSAYSTNGLYIYLYIAYIAQKKGIICMDDVFY